MTEQHPVTPPPELVEQWASAFYGTTIAPGEAAIYIATKAAQWGADQELEACCQSVKRVPSPLGVPFGAMASNALRAARRPKPPSLKEQALAVLDDVRAIDATHYNILRNALEALDD